MDVPQPIAILGCVRLGERINRSPHIEPAADRKCRSLLREQIDILPVIDRTPFRMQISLRVCQQHTDLRLRVQPRRI